MARRILMFGWELPPRISGGLGIACAGLAKALLRHSTDVTFVLPTSTLVSISGLRVLFADAFVSFSIPPRCLEPYCTKGGPGMSGEGRVGGLFDIVSRYASAARSIAVQTPHDVIHAHDWLCFPAGIAAKRASGKPLVVHVHATEFDRTGGGEHGINQDVYRIERDGMEVADMVIAVSNLTKQTIMRHYGISEEKIVVVYNGIDAESVYTRPSFPPVFVQWKQEGYKFVLYLGRITLQKGVEYLIRAAAVVRRYEPKIKCIIVGGGDMEEQIIAESVRLGLSDMVVFTGFLEKEERSSMYATADVFVSPSVSEPFGLTTLEALLHGVPVIVSKQTGVGEVVPNSIRVDFWDTDELANQIVGVLRHNALHTTLRQFGAQDMLRCTWDRAARQLISLYEQI